MKALKTLSFKKKKTFKICLLILLLNDHRVLHSFHIFWQEHWIDTIPEIPGTEGMVEGGLQSFWQDKGDLGLGKGESEQHGGICLLAGADGDNFLVFSSGLRWCSPRLSPLQQNLYWAGKDLLGEQVSVPQAGVKRWMLRSVQIYAGVSPVMINYSMYLQKICNYDHLLGFTCLCKVNLIKWVVHGTGHRYIPFPILSC